VNHLPRDYGIDGQNLEKINQLCKGTDPTVNPSRNYLTEAEFVAAIHIAYIFFLEQDSNPKLPLKLPDHLLRFIEDYALRQQKQKQATRPQPQTAPQGQTYAQPQGYQQGPPAQHSWSQQAVTQPGPYSQPGSQVYSNQGYSQHQSTQASTQQGPGPQTYAGYQGQPATPGVQGSYSSLPGQTPKHAQAFGSMANEENSAIDVLDFIRQVETISTKIRKEADDFSHQFDSFNEEQATLLHDIYETIRKIAEMTSLIQSTTKDITQTLDSPGLNKNTELLSRLSQLEATARQTESQMSLLKHDFAAVRSQQAAADRYTPNLADRPDLRHAQSLPHQSGRFPPQVPQQTPQQHTVDDPFGQSVPNFEEEGDFFKD
jgi:hypothetical protein